jgi:hypothetical protein
LVRDQDTLVRVEAVGEEEAEVEVAGPEVDKEKAFEVGDEAREEWDEAVVRVAVEDTVVGDMAAVREVIFVEEDLEVAVWNNLKLCRLGKEARVALLHEQDL